MLVRKRNGKRVLSSLFNSSGLFTQAALQTDWLTDSKVARAVASAAVIDLHVLDTRPVFFTILEAQNQKIVQYYVVKERCTWDFEDPNL